MEFLILKLLVFKQINDNIPRHQIKIYANILRGVKVKDVHWSRVKVKKCKNIISRSMSKSTNVNFERNKLQTIILNQFYYIINMYYICVCV